MRKRLLQERLTFASLPPLLASWFVQSQVARPTCPGGVALVFNSGGVAGRCTNQYYVVWL